ncbi:MAG TPA: glycosyltransferase [Pyrinomonadaceae bacterium]|jgi:glycosyltransferase involved in cell wall biosynthesis|nr:glycosyltransferase [Pyrinomonadaceae bacterium]
MKILITAPSLDESQNVSGISTIVRQIIEHGRLEYRHFTAGRKDREKANAVWVVKQAALPVRFFWRCLNEKPDVVHINTALTDLSIWRDAALAAAAKMAGRKVVLSIHGGKYLMNPFTSARVKNVTEKMLRRASAVIVYSELEKEEILKRWPELDVKVLPNAIPFADVPAVVVGGDRKNEIPVMVFFGRFHESKGLHETIEAVRVLKNDGYVFNFKAYGEGPEREFFLNGMREALGEHFHYGGIIAGKEKWQRLAEADIFVLPSRYGEGLPMAMLEAMAVGCVVVVADVASVTAVVTDGENGYVVQPKNTAQLVEKLKMLLDNRNDWKPVQENAIATVREKFAIADYIEKLEEIYKEAS